MAADFFAKALANVDKALGTEYAPPDHEDPADGAGTEASRLRRLDRYLLPMRHELIIRSAVYEVR